MAKKNETFKIEWKIEFPSKVGKDIIKQTFLGVSSFMEFLLPKIITNAPTYQGTDPRRKPGSTIKPYLRIVWTRSDEGIKYKTIGIPGGGAKGTPQYRALMATKSLHEGRRAFTTSRGTLMSFPLQKGQTFRNPKLAARAQGASHGRKNWVLTRKYTAKAWPAFKNPWILRTLQENIHSLTEILNQNYRKTGKKKKKVKVKK